MTGVGLGCLGAGSFWQRVRGVTDEADGVGEGLAERPEGASRGDTAVREWGRGQI